MITSLSNRTWSQINAFYLQKEAELRLRLETLLSKRRAAAARGIPDTTDTAVHSEWSAVEEGFRLLERDLGKLQVRNVSLLIVTISIHSHLP
jgi:CDK inhibitor PHO81